MLLMTPSEAAMAIGAKCGGGAPEDRDPQLLLLLRYMLARMEGAMDVSSLVRGTFTDTFYLTAKPCHGERPETQLLLSNGFIVPESITITDPDGEEITGADVENVNFDTGVVRLYDWSRGIWKITYDSGFEPEETPDPEPDGWNAEEAVLQDGPDWMRAICVEFLVVWYRSAFANPKAPSVGKSAGTLYQQVDQLMRREMYARVHSKYMRPRATVMFSEQLTRVA